MKKSIIALLLFLISSVSCSFAAKEQSINNNKLASYNDPEIFWQKHNFPKIDEDRYALGKPLLGFLGGITGMYIAVAAPRNPSAAGFCCASVVVLYNYVKLIVNFERYNRFDLENKQNLPGSEMLKLRRLKDLHVKSLMEFGISKDHAEQLACFIVFYHRSLGAKLVCKKRLEELGIASELAQEISIILFKHMAQNVNIMDLVYVLFFSSTKFVKAQEKQSIKNLIYLYHIDVAKAEQIADKFAKHFYHKTDGPLGGLKLQQQLKELNIEPKLGLIGQNSFWPIAQQARIAS